MTTRHDTSTSVVTALPLDDGGTVILDEFLDDSDTIAILPMDLDPAVRRYVADIQEKARRAVSDAEHAVVERIAAHFERLGGGRSVLMPTRKVADEVRSFVWEQPEVRAA
jgi:hypothetical protein